jgi:DnaJ-domain-containing protein 1
MGFWNDFNRLANFRIAWRLQDVFISSARRIQRANEEMNTQRSMASNAERIIDSIYNNDFEKNRNKPGVPLKRDNYEILGVSKSATKEEIKEAYRKKDKQYHPDINPNNNEAEAKFREATEAYEAII